ncbi:hypothetical protein [Pelagibacterium halotolerans]|uniref:hypothetical protein n=1 Tax=Pelagibacterium halotolerans TaxID=531813 RepID=UPI00384F0588
MADIDRDLHDRRHDEQRIYSAGGSAAGWWIAGILALAVLIIGFIALSGGNPAPVEGTTNPATGTAPITEPAPMTDAAPADTAPAQTAPAEPAPAETAPAESSTAPATEEAVPAQ